MGAFWGSPFGSAKGLGRLTRLSVWLLKRDIRPDWIVPGRPDQNGRHERMHRTLGEDTASPPAATLAAQQARFDRWRQIYNEFRPHEALGQTCPARHHQPSPRPYPDRLRPWEYPADHGVQRVGAKGYIKWEEDLIYLTEALAGEWIGIVTNDQGDQVIRFRNIDMAILPRNSRKIRNSDPA